MSTIEVRDYSGEKPALLAKFFLKDGEVKVTPDSSLTFVEETIKVGVVGLFGKRYFPKDGKKFLNALRVQYRSGVICAVPVD